MKSRWIKAVFLVVVGLSVITLLAGCSTSRTKSTVLEETRPVGLPPMPPDLLPEVYYVDVFFGAGCAQVPSGLRNCQSLLRKGAHRNLIRRLEEEVSAQFEDRFLGQVAGVSGDGGGFSEDMVFVSEITSTFGGHLALRDHESPVFWLEESNAYAMRVALVREEADYYLWTEISDRAKRAGRTSVAKAFQSLKAERYGDGSPNRDRIRKTEEEIAKYYTAMWNKARAEGGGP